MQFIESYSNDPEYNLAFEEWAAKNLPVEKESYLYLWINSPSIIIGKNQNAYAEIKRDYVTEHNIKVVRRLTGGGAVYHDLGNLNFSFIEKCLDNKKIDFVKYYRYIITALKELRLQPVLSGRNDVTIDGKKCIGASQAIFGNRVLSNGCILFNVQLDVLSKALNVRPEKLQTKGVKSVKARVENIYNMLPTKITIEEFKSFLLRSIFAQRGEEPCQYKLSDAELRAVKKIVSERFSKPAWNYGKSPAAGFHNYRYFLSGSIEVFFDVEKQLMQNVRIAGDFFSIADVADLQQLINGTVYDKNTLLEKLQSTDISRYVGAVTTLEFADLFFNL